MAFAPVALIVCWLIFPLGQFGKPYFDLAVFILAILLPRKSKLSLPWVLFLATNLLSFGLAQLQTPFNFTPILYLARLISMVLLLNQMPNISLSRKWLLVAWTTSLIFGFIQYLIFPDNTILANLGWDPHLNRLIGSFLDPTYTGLIFLLFLIYFFINKYPCYFSVVTYFGIALTYSRSTLLALFVVLIAFSFKNKNFKLFLFGGMLILTTILCLPNKEGEGTKLNRTSTVFAKVENYKEAISTIWQKPILGLGYNFLSEKRSDMGHASSGFDSSLLTIAATSGLVGLFFFLWAIKSQIDYLLLAILIHSLFSNSLLYPWVFFLLFSLRLKYRK